MAPATWHGAWQGVGEPQGRGVSHPLGHALLSSHGPPASSARSPRKGSWRLPSTGPREALRGHRGAGLGSPPHTPAPRFLLARAPGGGRPGALCSVAGEARVPRTRSLAGQCEHIVRFPALSWGVSGSWHHRIPGPAAALPPRGARIPAAVGGRARPSGPLGAWGRGRRRGAGPVGSAWGCGPRPAGAEAGG